MAEYWTLDAFENAGTKDIEIDGKALKIKALDPKVLFVMFKNDKPDGPDDGTVVPDKDEEVLKNFNLIDQICIAGLVVPAVSEETVDKLGRYKQQIAKEVMAFSGLGKTADKIEEFREEPVSSNG